MTQESVLFEPAFQGSPDLSPSFLRTVELKTFDPTTEHQYDPRIYYAEAATNQFRYAYAVTSGLPSGQEFEAANEHPALAHHGERHTRHYEKALKVVMGEAMSQREIGQILEGDFGRKLMQAMMLTVHFHDADQLAGEYRNLSLPKDQQLKVKKGHAMAAAVQIVAMTDLYEESLGISLEEAREITGMAAVMMMRHDEPGTVSQALSSENQDASEIQDTQELLRAYQSDTLNLSTLSPAQMVTILREIKGEAGFVGRDGSAFGLSPIFESDFANNLEAMQQDNSRILELKQNEQIALKAGTEMVVWADLVDMVSPYWDAIFRTFQGQYSKDRPFSWSYTGDTKNLPPEVDVLFSHVLDPKNGNGTVNDVERLLWELYNLDTFTQGTVLEAIPFVQEFNKEHAMMGAIALRQVAQVLYGGENVEKIVQSIFGNRVFRLNEKAQAQNTGLHTKRYWNLIKHLDEEAGDMITILQNKMPESQNDTSDYDYFNYIYGIFVRLLREKHRVTDEEFSNYDLLVQTGKSARTQLQMFTPDGLPPANATLTVLDPGGVRGE